MHSIVDPYEHPIISGILRGLAGWFAVTAAIGMTAGFTGNVLRDAAGPPQDWVGFVSEMALIAVWVRGWATQLALGRIPIGVNGRTLGTGPLSAGQARRWWAILWVAVALGYWSESLSFQGWQNWWLAPMFLRSATQAGWNRTLAQQELWRLRRELRWAAREHLRLEALVVRQLATPSEVAASASDIARLNRAVKAAAEAIRTAQPIAKPESCQTCR
jgi:hypothetical protein